MNFSYIDTYKQAKVVRDMHQRQISHPENDMKAVNTLGEINVYRRRKI